MSTIYNKVLDFLPSTSGLHFSNNYPKHTLFPIITLPVVGSIASSDAGNGICGGFAFTVLDMFLANPRVQPPADTTRPVPGTPRFDYLVRRQVDTLGSPDTFANTLKIINWIQTPDHDSWLTFVKLAPRGLANLLVREEWPKIKADIDSENPSPLMLVMEPRCVPLDIPGIITAIGHSHQVLAYAYSLDDRKNLKLWIYDCNFPNNDSSVIELNIANFRNTIDITASAMNIPCKIRGFFRSEYKKEDPISFR